jgi:RND family efflux transporter MFP subunit
MKPGTPGYTFFAALAVGSIASAFAQNPPATSAADSALATREIRAQLMPRRYVALAAEIGAKITQLPIAEGGRFKTGQILVTFDCALPAAQMQRAQAALSAAEQTDAGNRQLAELKSIGRIELGLSAAEVSKARADVAATQAVLSKCKIAAPFSGRIAEQKVREQQFVQSGQALLDIIDDSVLELEFIAPSQWLKWIRVGSTLQVQIDETGNTYAVKVQRIGARVDPVSQSIKLVAIPEGTPTDLIAGMSGRILAPDNKPATP